MSEGVTGWGLGSLGRLGSRAVRAIGSVPIGVVVVSSRKRCKVVVALYDESVLSLSVSSASCSCLLSLALLVKSFNPFEERPNFPNSYPVDSLLFSNSLH